MASISGERLQARIDAQIEFDTRKEIDELVKDGHRMAAAFKFADSGLLRQPVAEMIDESPVSLFDLGFEDGGSNAA